LGLTVSYNIIAAHGGILEVLADQKAGACFRVFLPTGELR
jgi:C4-dicarboxylate-specific signal transduction histidine kinase